MKAQDTDRMSLKEIQDSIEKHEIKCLECNGTLGAPRYFLTMFKTSIGPYSQAIGYGRPEAAQGVFVEFKRLYEQARERLPVGFATIGRVLRNEISPRQGPIRLREFTIIDLEFFIDPENPECPMLEEVKDETLRLVRVESRLQDSETPIEVTVKNAAAKGYIKMEWQAYFMALAKRFLRDLGVPDDKQLFIEKFKWERAHYSAQGFDQEAYLDRWGWVEVSGFNYRTDYDLQAHMNESGIDMKVFKPNGIKTVKTKTLIRPVTAAIGPDFKENMQKVIELLSKAEPEKLESALKKHGFYEIEGFRILPKHVRIVHEKTEETGRRFIPHVIEPSFGSDRLAYVALEYAYAVRQGRIVLGLPRDIVPVQLAVLPLVSKDGLPEKAKELYNLLLNEGYDVEYDETGSIGRRYARFDEIGTPLCITIDYKTVKEGTVTVRDRETWKQVRTRIDDLPKSLHEYFRHMIDFKKLGASI
jgi:glycyl-tRNA synthetase